MNYSISEQNSIQIVKVSSVINDQEKSAIINDLQVKIEKGFNQIVVDLSLIEFMTSVGLNFLISTMTRSRNNGGDMAIVNASNQVEKLLEMTKLKPLMNLNASMEDALSNLGAN